MASNKKGLGRGLSALIPDAEMDALSDVTRETRPVEVADEPSRKKLKRAAVGNDFVAAGSMRNGQHSTTSSVSLTQSPAQRKIGTSSRTGELLSGDVSSDKESKEPGPLMLAVDAIVVNPFQPRRTFGEEEMTELAASIGLHGVLQPILVRPDPSGTTGKYQLVAGERRWRAAQKAGLRQLPVIVRPMGDQQALELALIENVQRHDISAIDAALAYQRLANEFTLSQEQIARRVGKSRSAVANTIRLLDLPEEARKAVESGAMSEGHGRAILLASSEGTRRALLRRVLRDRLSVRETENLARDFVQQEASSHENVVASAKALVRSGGNEWQKAEQDCTKRLGARVKIQASRRRSTIIIECGTSDELQRVLALLQAKH